MVINRSRIGLAFVVIFSALMIYGCANPTATPGAVSTDPALQAIVSPMAENLMNALRNNDFQAFRANYDQAMLDSTSISSFQDLRSQIATKLGAYQSLTPRQIQTSEGYINAFYDVNFEKGSLILQLVLTESEPHLIHGFGFK
jgi:hypothetical protein